MITRIRGTSDLPARRFRLREKEAPNSPHVFTVAIVGNPNTGKSTLFSALVGVHQHVGNYPGVTVEKRTGRFVFGGRQFEIVDLPGLYSLAPRSRDEMVVVDVLLGRQPDLARLDAVICIADAGNLSRNLYVVSQVLELGLPTVLAVNMMDLAERRGIHLDLKRLERQLGIPVVPLQAHRRIGISQLKEVLAAIAAKTETRTETTSQDFTPFPEVFEQEVSALSAALTSEGIEGKPLSLPRALVRRLLLDVSGYLEKTLLQRDAVRWRERITAVRSRLTARGCEVPQIETSARYDWINRVLEGVVAEPKDAPPSFSDRLDRLLTHRVWGTVFFAVVLLVMFQAVFVLARPAMEGMEAFITMLGSWVELRLPAGAVRSLLVNGVIGGVGAVLTFLPQIMILFAFLALLEDCGYMARTTFLTDRLMLTLGLSGKCFIPLLSCFGCAVPGIMATRVIENERERLATILIAPLLTCPARLPIYTLLIAAFVPARSCLGGLLSLQGLTLAGLYLLGIFAAIMAALILKLVRRGRTLPLLMELPTYKWPSLRTVVMRMVERGWVFIRCAGTLILAVSILVWAALYFPRNPNADHRQQQRESYLGKAGRVIEPLVKPLGWDWRIGCAVLASFPAREIVVATLGVMYHLEEEGEDGSPEPKLPWTEKLKHVTWEDSERPVFNLPVALSIMVFFALCAQCAATLAVIRRETNSWRWPAFVFTYMTALAYVAALTTYQIGIRLWGGC